MSQITMNVNVASASAARDYKETQDKFGLVSSQLSSGKRIVSSSVDAAGAAIATKMNVNVAALGQADRNASQANAMLSTAEGGLEEINNIVTRLKELSVGAVNDTNGDEERAFLDLEFQALVLEIDNIAERTRWNGSSLLDADTTYNFQVADKSTDLLGIDIGASTSSDLGLTGLDLSSDAAAAQDAVDTAVGTLNTSRAQIGAAVKSLEVIKSSLGSSIEKAQNGASVLEDMDVATGITEFANLQTRLQVQQAVVMQNNQQTSALSKFFN